MEILPEILKNKKVCLVTDWLTNLGGAEKVLKLVASQFPDAPIYTTVANKDNIGDLADHEIRTSRLQKIPGASKKHQFLLPLLAGAIESLDVSEFEVVLSFSSAFAKGIKTNKNQMHLCYIHTPIRYAWEPDFDPRVERLPGILKPSARRSLEKIRKWDYETRHRPDHYIANSSMTQERVLRYYGFKPEALYPPVKVSDFRGIKKEEVLENFIAVGRLVPYKKFDMIAQAFQKMPQYQLEIIGDGPERSSIEFIVKESPNIKMLGRLSHEKLINKFVQSRALILPQVEDAGIVQLEAFAAGTPVVAYEAGGVRDVLQEGINGVFFQEQSMEGICRGVEDFVSRESSFSATDIKKTVEAYDESVFLEKYLSILEHQWNK